MKIRSGFVSNSSSSSFIVIGNNYNIKNIDKHLIGDEDIIQKSLIGGQTELGWLPENFNSFYDKLNFVLLQILDMQPCDQYIAEEWEKMLITVLNEELNLSMEEIDWRQVSDINGYIDHQSAANEGKNIEMFENINSLKCFLFSTSSLIHTDNDNH